MRANELLLWMSARGRGSWQQFRAAVEELHLPDTSDEQSGGVDDDSGDARNALPLQHELRLNLERHGHVEFFEGAGETGWRVTPPSLASTRYGNGWIGVLAGARTTRLMQRVEAAASAASTTLERLTVPASPEQIRIMGSTPAGIAAVASDAGLLFQDDAPTALLASLPVVDDPVLRRPVELPFGDGWRVERFSVTELRWRVAIREDIPSSGIALFRFSLRHRRQIVLWMDEAAHEIPGPVGKFLVMKRRRQVARYDTVTRSLIFPVICRPPLLVQRALILCSGLPASYEPDGDGAGHLLYKEIDPPVARLACALLRQELR
jgi:hypothetical protein